VSGVWEERGLKLTWALYLCRLSLTSELGGDHDCCIPRLIHSWPTHATPSLCGYVRGMSLYSSNIRTLDNQSTCHQLILPTPSRIQDTPLGEPACFLLEKTDRISLARRDTCRQPASPHSIVHTTRHIALSRLKRETLLLQTPVAMSRDECEPSKLATSGFDSPWSTSYLHLRRIDIARHATDERP
jgi:hypothetical protein